MEQFTWLLLIFLLGLAIGSFVNVVVGRLNQGQAPTGRSHCPHCQHQLSASDLIPLVSFLLLRGRCRYCKQRIAWRYPLVELGMGVAFLTSAIVVGPVWWLSGILLTVAFMAALFLSDLWYHTVPDVLSLPAIALGVITALAIGRSWRDVLFGAVLGGGFFALQHVLSRGRWVGDGDSRLGLLLGALLGVRQLLVALVLTYVAGAVIALGLLWRRRAQMKSQLPLGALLMPAGWVSLLVGGAIADWYTNGGVFRSLGLDAVVEWFIVRVYGL